MGYLEIFWQILSKKTTVQDFLQKMISKTKPIVFFFG